MDVRIIAYDDTDTEFGAHRKSVPDFNAALDLSRAFYSEMVRITGIVGTRRAARITIDIWPLEGR